MGAKICEDEVQRTLDFCVNLFNPTTPEQHEAVREELSRLQLWETPPSRNTNIDTGETESPVTSWMDVHAPIVSPSNLARMLRTRLRSLSGSSSSSPLPSSTSPLFVSPPPLLPSADATATTASPLNRVTEERHPQASEDKEMRMVLEKVNARRVIHVDHMEGLNSLEQEDVSGFVVRLSRGELGLVRATPGAKT